MPKYGHNNTTKNKKSWQVKESVLRDETNSRERIDLNPEAFDRLIQQKGVVAKVYRSMYCPKVKSVDGAEHEIDCVMCNGSGFLDIDPICVNVFIQSQELENMPAIEGFVDGNTVKMTFPIGVEMHYFTLIELEDFPMIFHQRVLRAPGTLTDVLKYKTQRINALIDYNNKRYFQDVDFAIDVSGNIKWLTSGDKQKATFSSVPTSGTWTLTYGATATSALAFNAPASAVQTALRLISGLEVVTVTGDYTAGFTITFVGVDAPVSILTHSSSLLNGITAVTIGVVDVSGAADKPNDNVPYSAHYQCMTQYRATAAIHSNRYTQVRADARIEHIKMPEQWYCVKEYLVKRKDFDGNETEQGPYSKHTIVTETGGTESN